VPAITAQSSRCDVPCHRRGDLFDPHLSHDRKRSVHKVKFTAAWRSIICRRSRRTGSVASLKRWRRRHIAETPNWPRSSCRFRSISTIFFRLPPRCTSWNSPCSTGSSIRLTAAGRVFAQNDSDERERLFLEHLIRFVPLVAHIRQVLDERENHEAPRERFELQDHLNRTDADHTRP
jgi:hypothetical protein